ncbi:MAG: 23S rRNA (guanosine(2251)-2'-O)-methyltransferase RlmB [Proteobacteria bacterium]|nr:23S rRNA (guanosine(2251)-2'-O)-methyltransferase RlmB [Pseudomonadota bacterium]
MKKRYHKSGQPQQSNKESRREGRPEGAGARRFDDKKPRERDGKTHFKRDDRPAHIPVPKLVGPLLWGFHPVAAAWLNPQRGIVRLMVTDTGLESFQATLDEAKALGIRRPRHELIDKAQFERMMPSSAVHQGIAALVEALDVRDAHDLIANLQEGEPSTIVILDQVTDPHNVGAILRSASAFGCTGVILQDRHAPELTGVLAKTASGAVDVIPVAVETNLSRTIEMLQEHGFFVVGLDERGTPIGALPKHNRVALVLGAEGAGLRRLVSEHCDALVALPTLGSIRSLNVSNAAAVALYAVKASA